MLRDIVYFCPMNQIFNTVSFASIVFFILEQVLNAIPNYNVNFIFIMISYFILATRGVHDF